jgi:hypothetical protein
MDEQTLLKRFFDDNELYPDAMNTGIAIGDGLLKAQARLSAMFCRAHAIIARLITTTPRPV